MNDIDNVELSYQATINKLESELSKLRKDKERLDWLIDNALMRYYPTTCPDDLCCIENRDDIDEGMNGTEI